MEDEDLEDPGVGLGDLDHRDLGHVLDVPDDLDPNRDHHDRHRDLDDLFLC
ncbi:hypothetical protein D3C72_2386390 [compost metagenome]